MKDVSTKPYGSSDDFNDRIAGLSPAKQALLELWLKKSPVSAAARQTIARRSDRESAPPLSFAQQRLWFLDQLEPNSGLYNISTALLLSGPLNVEALQKSLAAVVERHEALRTTFASVDGEPVQVINVTRGVALAMIDLSAWPKDNRELEVQRLLKQEARRPFNLFSDLMLRAILIRLGEEENILLLVMHHIASDGWSIGVLFRELGALYDAFCNEKPSPLPELPIQYADYAIWQQQWLQSEVFEKQLSYWKKQLSGISTLQLPTDWSRPAVQSHRGARQSLMLSEELTESLKALSRKEGATLFMTLLAAFQILLYRLTGQDDVAVGSPIANRNRAEIEGLIGFFVNALILRTNFSGNPTFKELLAQVREMALGAYAHQDLPFEKLVEELKPERSLSHSPLFQVMFVLQNAPSKRVKFEGLSASPVPIGAEGTKFDLTLTMSETEEGLRGSIQYNTDVFDDATISRMLGHFQLLLESIVANPEQCVSDLPILTQAERQQLLVAWNDTKIGYPKDKCIHHLVEEQVDRTPDAVAVVFEDRQLTYRELNQRANQLAHYLRELKVGPEVLVGICMERSLEVVVGLLGILKAGGTYIPLDPDYPAERLVYMLEDARASVVVTQHKLIEKLSDYRAQMLCLDTDWKSISKERHDNPKSSATSANLAYVIYTSGSTGKPKGVQIQHCSVINLLCSMRKKAGLAKQDTLLAVTTLSFDIAGLEIYLPLILGARTVFVSREVASDAVRLAKQLSDSGVTVMQATPATWQMLFGNGWPGSDHLKILCGGEALQDELAKRLIAGGSSTWNLYGPTETTIWSATYQVFSALGSVPIGSPIDNTQIYVLDAHLQPVPVGICGELYIGGDGLARGYLNRPELTAEKFIANPFSAVPGARLYRTSDIARYLPDGNIEFLGRTDYQVKLRGYRIELGEIESVLGQHVAVGEAAVVAREDSPGDKRLVAYVVPRQEAAPKIDEFRSFLKQKLPEYMVPSVFVFLDALPRTPNGKVDRKTLPAPEQSGPLLERSFVAPLTPIEQRLAEIWLKLLGVNQVSIRDNFFDLGGHSLLAVRLFAEIEKAFKKRPPLSGLFQEPTIEHLATLITQENPTPTPSSLVVIQPNGSKPPFFCVHELFGDVLCYMNLARNLGEERPFYALQARGLNNGDEPFDDIEIMAAYYIDQIRTVQPHGPYALGGLCFGGVVAFEMAQQLRAKGEPVALVALLDSGIGLNVSKFQWWWRFFQNLPLDFRSWMTGALQLTGTQWSELIKIKTAATKGQLGGIFGLSAGGSQPNDVAARLKRLGDVFQFSDRHQRVARAQYRALKNYKAQKYTGRLTLFRARMQPFFSSHDPHKGWSCVAAGGVDVRHIPGNHLGMLQEPHVQVLARELKACLERQDQPENEPKSHLETKVEARLHL